MTEPRLIDCREAAEKLYPYLDRELTTADERAVREHLADCAKCFRVFELEGVFLGFLNARTAAMRAPNELKKRIFETTIWGEDSQGSE